MQNKNTKAAGIPHGKGHYNVIPAQYAGLVEPGRLETAISKTNSSMDYGKEHDGARCKEMRPPAPPVKTRVGYIVDGYPIFMNLLYNYTTSVYKYYNYSCASDDLRKNAMDSVDHLEFNITSLENVSKPCFAIIAKCLRAITAMEEFQVQGKSVKMSWLYLNYYNKIVVGRVKIGEFEDETAAKRLLRVYITNIVNTLIHELKVFFNHIDSRLKATVVTKHSDYELFETIDRNFLNVGRYFTNMMSEHRFVSVYPVLSEEAVGNGAIVCSGKNIEHKRWDLVEKEYIVYQLAQ